MYFVAPPQTLRPRRAPRAKATQTDELDQNFLKCVGHRLLVTEPSFSFTSRLGVCHLRPVLVDLSWCWILLLARANCLTHPLVFLVLVLPVFFVPILV